jgi:hypothetical protein
MGSHYYCYFALFNSDLNQALQTLRETEFRAGRYDPALSAATPPVYTFALQFPPDETWPAPGAQHVSIEKAL